MSTHENVANAESTASESTSPVTVVATRRVKPGHEEAYEGWLRSLFVRARELPGYVGAEVHRPANGSREYTSVFRFESVDALQDFERSDLRRNALAEVAPHVEGDAVWTTLTGLELWFAPPPGTVVPQPSRLRMALVLVVVVYLLVLSIGSGVAIVLADLPFQARLLVTITIEVFLLTYVLMPRLTRWLARWIYPDTVVR